MPSPLCTITILALSKGRRVALVHPLDTCNNKIRIMKTKEEQSSQMIPACTHIYIQFTDILKKDQTLQPNFHQTSGGGQQ